MIEKKKIHALEPSIKKRRHGRCYRTMSLRWHAHVDATNYILFTITVLRLVASHAETEKQQKKNRKTDV